MSARNMLKTLSLRLKIYGNIKQTNVLRSLHGEQLIKTDPEKLSDVRKDMYSRFDKIKNLQKFQIKFNSAEQREKLIRPVVRKFTEMYDWYGKIVGLDQVKIYQNRVITMQDQLSNAQTERRVLDRRLKEKRNSLNKLQQHINKINRYQDNDSGMKYMELIQEEMNEMSEERDLCIKFEDVDKKEREIFTAFCVAIRDSQEQERIQAEKSKNLGYMLSIIGVVIGIVGNKIFNYTRDKYLISGIEGVNTKIGNIDDKISGVVAAMRMMQEKWNTFEESRKEENEVKKEDSGKSFWSYFWWGSLQEITTDMDSNANGNNQQNGWSIPGSSVVIRAAYGIARAPVRAYKWLFGY